MSHVPVLLPEVLTALSPANEEVYIDGTFGGGGYTQAILEHAHCEVIALDRDRNVLADAIDFSSEYGKRFQFCERRYSQMEEVVDGLIDGVVLDIGVSSMQIDQAERGFSFQKNGPLDMRMSDEGVSASDAVNQLEHSELVQIFKAYGEERRARRCADFIVQAREQDAIMTTSALADLISKALGRSGKTHPATRVFQALRIFVNDELGELYKGLLAAEQILKPGGRLIVVTFHSLEDRIVKSFFKTRSATVGGGSRHLPPQDKTPYKPTFELVRGGSVAPSKSEQSANPRSRSARLRAGIRLDSSVWDGNESILPSAPSLVDFQMRIARREKSIVKRAL